MDELKKTAARLRGEIIRMSCERHIPHLGSSLSCADILTAVYWGGANVTPENVETPDRDRVILSKGHAASALYGALYLKGILSEEVYESYSKDGSVLQEHPGPRCAPGVEAATGSLGHGLGIALGMAEAGRWQGRDYRVYAVMSDGECNEGSTWEAVLYGAAKKVNRVTAFVDYNKWQATGRSNEVMGLAPLREKWVAFGWDAHEIDGHDMESLVKFVQMEPHPEKPRVIICNTVKGKGVSFMEDDNNWHYRTPNPDELQQAYEELGLK